MNSSKKLKSTSCLSLSSLGKSRNSVIDFTQSGEETYEIMASNGALDRRVIGEIQTQLSTHFLPAVKNVAASGNELLRAFQALQRATDAYTTSLGSLARSAKGACPEAEKYGKRLLEFSKQFKEIMQHHDRSVQKFGDFVQKTNKFSTEEKDKQKELFGNFQKIEKSLQKSKKQDKLDGFYGEERQKLMKQQEMRYKFFLDKHEEWFQTYADLIEYCQEMASKEEENERKEVAKETEKPKAEMAAPVLEIKELPKENGHNESETKDSSRTSSASSIEGVRTRVSTQNDPNSISLISERQRESTIQVEVPKPAPRAQEDQSRGGSILQSNQPVQGSILAEIAQENKAFTNNPVYTQSRDWELNPQPPSDYRAPPRAPSPVNDEYRMPRGVSPIRNRPALQQTQNYAPLAVDPPPQRAPPKFGYQVFPPMTSIAAQPPAPLPVYAAEVRPKPTPAPRPVPAAIVPQPFSAPDYGMCLEVNEDFNANGQDQLTVNRGDQVVLIKSGNRGWIFIKEQATNRTGWIPAQFASKI